jgi:type II secretory ATPase GspE/PulE/Tfp pilus assembly ATPase PilB-like protein
LEVVIAQRLVRRLCGEKEKYTLKESELKNLQKHCDLERILKILKEERIVKLKDAFGDVEFYRPKPTKEYPEGYSDRIGIFEVLPITETIKELIVKRATSDQIMAQAQKEGMRTMIEDGFVKAAQGLTSIEEVLRVIIE